MMLHVTKAQYTVEDCCWEPSSERRLHMVGRLSYEFDGTLTLLVLLVHNSVEVEAVDERAHGLAGRVGDQAFV